MVDVYVLEHPNILSALYDGIDRAEAAGETRFDLIDDGDEEYEIERQSYYRHADGMWRKYPPPEGQAVVPPNIA